MARMEPYLCGERAFVLLGLYIGPLPTQYGAYSRNTQSDGKAGAVGASSVDLLVARIMLLEISQM